MNWKALLSLCLKNKSRQAIYVCFALLGLFGAQVTLAADVEAKYASPTTIYKHGVFGRDFEYKSLVVTSAEHSFSYELPNDDVFEDLTPRLYFIGARRFVASVVSNAARGASLVVYEIDGEIREIARTEAIGMGRRWLAPIGVGDLDHDGVIDLSYIETPHLRPNFRLFNFDGRVIVENQTARFQGASNHRFGEGHIKSTIVNCARGDVLVIPEASYAKGAPDARLMLLEFDPENTRWRGVKSDKLASKTALSRIDACGAL